MKSVDSSPTPRRPRLAPAFRLTLLVAAIGALSCVLLLQGARAQFDGAMLGLGSRAMAFPGAPRAETRTVRINGVEVKLRTEVVDAPLPSVLRHYQSVCGGPRERSTEYGGIIAALATRSRATARDGYVACLETGAGDLETLVERIKKFSETWDLSDVGALRYAYATRASERPEGQTFLLTMWADGSVNLHDFVPLGMRDATGTDLVGVPRPPNSQRILSASEASGPSGVYVYRANGAQAAELARAYRRALSLGGWDILERNQDQSILVDDVLILAAEKGGRTLSVLVNAGASPVAVVTLLISEAG